MTPSALTTVCPCGVGFLEASARVPEARAYLAEVPDAKGEVSARVQAELGVCGEMHVPRASRVPDARAILQRRRPLDLLQTERIPVEPPSAGVLARRIEHLGVM